MIIKSRTKSNPVKKGSNPYVVYILPLLLILCCTLVKFYAFGGILYFGYPVPVGLFLLSCAVSWVFAGTRSLVAAFVLSVAMSVTIIVFPSAFSGIPANHNSVITFVVITGLVVLLIAWIQLKNLDLHKEKDEYFKFVADSVPDKLWISDPSGSARYYNQEWFDFTGYGEMKDLKENVWKLLHPDERAWIQKVYQENLSRGTGYEMEHRMQDKKGVYRWHLSRTRPLLDQKGRITLWVGSSTDIHDRKIAEEVLRESEQHFRNIADNAPIIIWQTDNTGQITYVSRQWENYSGCSTEEDLNVKWKKSVHPDDLNLFQRNLEESINSQTEFHGKYRIRAEDGSYRWFLAIGKPLFDDKFKGLLGSLTDITDQEELQQQSKALLRKMDEFISIASHELKTPVTSIRGYLQIMQMEAVKNNHQQYLGFLDKVSSQQLRLSKLIQDLLDISKIQEGKVDLNYSHFQLKDIIEDALYFLKNSYPKHTIEIEGEVDISVVADYCKIEQVLTNLLANAAKYSPECFRILLQVEKREENAVISVVDFGIGISERSQHFIFDRFYRVEEVSFKFSGLGIGLYICREIIRRHGGDIWFESKEGKGSTFSFSLPLIKAEQKVIEKQIAEG